MLAIRLRIVGAFGFVPALALTPSAGAVPTPLERAVRGADAPGAQLQMTSTRTLASGTVVRRFTQEVGGVPVQGAGAVVLDLADAPPELLFDKTRPAVGAPGEPRLSRAAAIGAATRAVGVRAHRAPPTAGLVVAADDDALAWEVLQPSARPLGDFVVTVDAASGLIISKHNMTRRATGQAELFNPNPVVANSTYMGIRDRNDKDSAALTALRQPVTLEHLRDGQTCLRGDYANVLISDGFEFKAARRARKQKVCKDSLDWSNIRRRSNQFEALMAYAHIDRAQMMIQQLDLAPINDEPQDVISKGVIEPSSAYFFEADQIHLGTEGVDDGEDADIILHEYGHAVQDAQNPDAYRGSANQVRAQGEGFGDYLAAAYSTEMTGFDPEWTFCLAEWDATTYDEDTPSSPGICLRRADNPNTWDEQKVACGGNEAHCIGEVWASALFDLRTTLGDDGDGDSIGDTVVLAAHELTPPSPTFQQASEALIAADLALYGGAHCLAIEAEVESRGLFTGTPCV